MLDGLDDALLTRRRDPSLLGAAAQVVQRVLLLVPTARRDQARSRYWDDIRISEPAVAQRMDKLSRMTPNHSPSVHAPHVRHTRGGTALWHTALANLTGNLINERSRARMIQLGAEVYIEAPACTLDGVPHQHDDLCLGDQPMDRLRAARALDVRRGEITRDVARVRVHRDELVKVVDS